MPARRRVTKKEAIQLGLPWYECGTVIDGREFHGYRKNISGSVSHSWIKTGYKDSRRIKVMKRLSAQKKFIRRVKLMFGCRICGYKKHFAALHFNHKDQDTKDNVISRMHGSNIRKIKDEIRKCDILCANCHAEYTYVNEQHNSRNKDTP